MRTFLKLNNVLGQVVIQLQKSPPKSKLFRRESISKLPGGKPMNIFFVGLWSSYQIWQLWNALMLKRVGLVQTFFYMEKFLCQVVIQFLKSLHKSDSFRRESISKLPCLIWWPQTKGKNVHSPWKFWNAVTAGWHGWTRADFF